MRAKHDRGIPWRDVPIGPFEGALYAWVGKPPGHSSRLEHGIYIKTCNALVALNGTSWGFGYDAEPWHVVGYRPVELKKRRKGTLMNWKLFLEGLFSAAVGGAATGVTQLVSSTGQVNRGTGTASIIGAILGIAAYLKTPATQANQQNANPPKQ